MEYGLIGLLVALGVAVAAVFFLCARTWARCDQVQQEVGRCIQEISARDNRIESLQLSAQGLQQKIDAMSLEHYSKLGAAVAEIAGKADRALSRCDSNAESVRELGSKWASREKRARADEKEAEGAPGALGPNIPEGSLPTTLEDATRLGLAMPLGASPASNGQPPRLKNFGQIGR